MFLLLSGDVELNPGPMIDDQPSRRLFVKYLKPLVDWKPFALCLPGITQTDVNIIDKTKRNAKAAIHQIWLEINPTASWRDVINALKQCKENELVQTIEHQMKLESIEGTESMEIIDLTSESTSGKDTLNKTLINWYPILHR